MSEQKQPSPEPQGRRYDALDDWFADQQPKIEQLPAKSSPDIEAHAAEPAPTPAAPSAAGPPSAPAAGSVTVASAVSGGVPFIIKMLMVIGAIIAIGTGGYFAIPGLTSSEDSPSEVFNKYHESIASGGDVSPLLSFKTLELYEELDLLPSLRVREEAGAPYIKYRVVNEVIEGERAWVTFKIESDNPVEAHLKMEEAEIEMKNAYNRKVGDEEAIAINNALLANSKMRIEKAKKMGIDVGKLITETEWKILCVKEGGRWKLAPAEQAGEGLKQAFEMVENLLKQSNQNSSAGQPPASTIYDAPDGRSNPDEQRREEEKSTLLEEQEQKTQIDGLLSTARNCYQNKNYNECLQHASQVLGIDPNNAEAKEIAAASRSELQKIEEEKIARAKREEEERKRGEQERLAREQQERARLEQERLERERQIQLNKEANALVAAFEGCLRNQKFAQAEAQLNALVNSKYSKTDACKKLNSLREELRAAKAQYEKMLTLNKEANNIVNDFERCIIGRDLQGAENTLSRLDSKYSQTEAYKRLPELKSKLETLKLEIYTRARFHVKVGSGGRVECMSIKCSFIPERENTYDISLRMGAGGWWLSRIIWDIRPGTYRMTVCANTTLFLDGRDGQTSSCTVDVVYPADIYIKAGKLRYVTITFTFQPSYKRVVVTVSQESND